MTLETTYVTPAGYTCTCGETKSAIAGGQSRRMADLHSDKKHPLDGNVIDYRLSQQK